MLLEAGLCPPLFFLKKEEMPAVIHIIQENAINIIESTIISVRDVEKLYCVYQKEADEHSHSLTPEKNELEILLHSGEVLNIEMTPHIIIRLIYKDEVICQTHDLQVFEKAYIKLIGCVEGDEMRFYQK